MPKETVGPNPATAAYELYGPGQLTMSESFFHEIGSDTDNCVGVACD